MKSLFLIALKNEARGTFYDLYRFLYHRSKSYHFIFILSHMRAGTSLLTKLVSDNPDVNGYGETHLRYRSSRDYRSSIGKILFVNRHSSKNGQGNYVLDKLLHNYLLPLENMNLLLARNARVIFLIREPEESIASMTNVLHMTVEDSYNYYMDRLAMLERYSKIITANSPAVMVTYQQILHQTDVVFKLLEEYLDLSAPLRETYKLTTRSEYGSDPSANLASGRILRNTSKQELKHFPKEWRERAQSRYVQCYQTLSQNCVTLGDQAPVDSFSDTRTTVKTSYE